MSHSASGRLKSAALDLSNAVNHSLENWRDAKAEEFQKQRITPILRSVESACQAMDEMAQIVSQMQRDCGPLREDY
jgi:hypothetical protein